MSRVDIREVSKRYGSVTALDRVSLTLADGEFFGLLGPSGSGKTTLLRAIAGFVEPDGGEIRIDPRDLLRVQARENYCELVLDRGESTTAPLVRTTLAEVLERLPADRFVRVHRSHLVNLDAVSEWHRKGRNASLVLRNGDTVPIARSRLAAVRQAIERLVGSASAL